MKYIKLLFSISFLIGYVTLAFGGDTLTKREVYNFQVGDIFHTKFSYTGPPVFVIREIVSKYNSSNQDTVTYETLDTTYNFKNQNWSFEVSTATLVFTNLNSLAYSDDVNPLSFDSLISKHDFCNTDIETLYLSNTEGYRKFHYFSGIGRYYFIFQGASPDIEFALLYYKKNGKECGNRIRLSSIDVLNFQALEVYPNPTAGLIHINGIDQGRFEIYNTLGSLMQQGKIEKEIDVSDQLPGLYFISVRNGEAIFTARFIKH